MLTLQPMQANDLDLVTGWLETPEVARWYLAGSTLATEIGELRRCMLAVEPTTALLVLERGTPWSTWR